MISIDEKHIQNLLLPAIMFFPKRFLLTSYVQMEYLLTLHSNSNSLYAGVFSLKAY